MKIASFNVNSLRARLDIVLRWLDQEQPEVVCFQETKVQDVDFPANDFEKSGYQCVFKGQKSYNGVAVLSKAKMENVKAGFDDEPKDQSRLIRVDIDGIALVNTYVPQGYLPDSEKFEYKLKWFDRLRDYFESNFKSSDPVIWLGDLNVAPLEIDVYAPKRLYGHVCFGPDVHKWFKKVSAWGFVDVFRMHCDEPGQYTFWDYRQNSVQRNLGWRLDHIMATKPLAEKCSKCYIDKEPRTAKRPSDHTPIVACFDW